MDDVIINIFFRFYFYSQESKKQFGKMESGMKAYMSHRTPSSGKIFFQLFINIQRTHMETK